MDSFTPNAEALAALTAMGIEKHVAEQALFKTGNQSCDAAISYVFDGSARKPNPGSRGRDDPAACKMVFVVNEALDMGVGKMASQVAHGCLGLYKLITANDWNDEDILLSWEGCGEKKVVLKATNHLELQELEAAGNMAGLPTYMVQDAGLTEIPAGSLTVLALFGYEEDVDAVTGDLNLL